MSKIVLMMFLCVSLQGCITTPDSSKSDIPSIIGNKAKEKEEKNGLLAITQFMAVMAVLKTQTE
ncbi:hypothetical protein [Moritella yayanosii]|uniref:Lipoprotein n=1 Tax=Moritella yayanosii TaxID=69539 RepID=A0A330LTW5_9GAMM|nr:hypothetical protein [Moritella yayanosii]SQD80203.1 conserved protein of unknown function [Moritella yayanosii]